MWNIEDLNPDQKDLLDLVTDAHRKSSFRANPSSVAVQIAAQGSGNYIQSMIAALSTLGGVHGPLIDTYDLIYPPWPEFRAEDLLLAKKKVPGWGNGFVKGSPDPIWDLVALKIKNSFRDYDHRISLIQKVIDRYKPNLFPNPSCYTAITAMALDMPKEMLGWILVQARLLSWSQLYLDSRVSPSWRQASIAQW